MAGNAQDAETRAQQPDYPAAALRDTRRMGGAARRARRAARPRTDTRAPALAAARAHAAEEAVRRAYLETITALARVVEAKDSHTGAHVERVRNHALAIGRRLGLKESVLHQLEYGALLHDIGKIAVPDRVLAKPRSLDAVDWGFIHLHPNLGCRILEGISFLDEAIEGVVSHHERWDGGGYPKGLCGDAIPLFGRIIAVADAFDAMTQDRPYRKAMPVEIAIDVLRHERGRQFDPQVVDALLAEVLATHQQAA